jgi:hypothetical protein
VTALRFSAVRLRQPGARDREAGMTSQPYLLLLTVAGRVREVPLEEDELVKLIAEASRVLAVLRGVRV